MSTPISMSSSALSACDAAYTASRVQYSMRICTAKPPSSSTTRMSSGTSRLEICRSPAICAHHSSIRRRTSARFCPASTGTFVILIAAYSVSPNSTRRARYTTEFAVSDSTDSTDHSGQTKVTDSIAFSILSQVQACPPEKPYSYFYYITAPFPLQGKARIFSQKFMNPEAAGTAGVMLLDAFRPRFVSEAVFFSSSCRNNRKIVCIRLTKVFFCAILAHVPIHVFLSF